MIVADVFDEARDAFGNCSQEQVFPRLTMAIEALANKSPGWDAGIGEMTICVRRSIVTLPNDVETPLGVQVNGVPAIARDAWFRYHANGTGGPRCTYQSPWYWDDYQNRPIIRELEGPHKLMAVPQYATDNGKSFRVFATDEADRNIYSLNPDGSTTEGFLLTMSNDPTIVTDRVVKYIQRIVRAKTNGYVRLFAINVATNEAVLLGDYGPDDTEPSYRRMRVQNCSVVRMRYRRKTFAVKSLNDYIPLDNKLALIMACKSVKAMLLNHFTEAEAFMAQALKLANDEQDTRNAQSGTGIQVNVRDGSFNDTLYGMSDGWGCGWGNGGYGGYW